jgi:hypothetical protein
MVIKRGKASEMRSGPPHLSAHPNSANLLRSH